MRTCANGLHLLSSLVFRFGIVQHAEDGAAFALGFVVAICEPVLAALGCGNLQSGTEQGEDTCADGMAGAEESTDLRCGRRE